MNYKKIGEFICKLRKENNWTQDELAQKLIVDRATISKWERGIYIPNPEMLLNLQKIFGVSINEILYGERKNSENENNINSIPAEIIKSNSKKIKKIIYISFFSLFSLIVCFLLYYFFNNYNSISVYRIYGGNDNYYIRDGLMIVSNEKSYIKLGKIVNNTKDKIEKIRLYFMNENIEHSIFTGNIDSTNELLINNFNYNELFKYSDLEYLKSNLFMEIILDNGDAFVIDLKVKKDFSNNNLFDDVKFDSISNGNENSNNNITIPDYIKNNFKYDEKEEKYYKETDNIKEEYFAELELYILNKTTNIGAEHFEYSFLDKSIVHYVLKEDIISDNFSYSLSLEKCNYGKCDNTLINYFIQDYVEKFNFN